MSDVETRVGAALVLAELTPSQLAFLRLHVKHGVDMWQWHFCDSMLRAHAGHRRATIWRDDLDNLIARGMVVRGVGVTIYPTIDARELFA